MTKKTKLYTHDTGIFFEETIREIDGVETQPIQEPLYLVFNSLAEAETKQAEIDVILGYEGSMTTKHAYEIIKHPTLDKWLIEVSQIEGTTFKKKDVRLLSQEEKVNSKNKQNIIDEGWYASNDEINE